MISEKIRTILLSDWDPCAIGQNPNLQTDYDEFIPELQSAILASKSADEIVQILRRIENEIRAPVDDELRQAAARKLAALV